MKKFLQWLSVFVPLSLAFAAFMYAAINYGEYLILAICAIMAFVTVAAISAGIAGSIYADKTLQDEDTYLW